jgi:uncharacterized protein YjbI with pentapeptide repeats
LTIQKIEEGSVRFTLKSSEEGFRRIQQLFSEEKLYKLLDFPIEYLIEASNDNEDARAANKFYTVEEIRSQGAEGRDLRAIDLRSTTFYLINLSHANLSEANLHDAVLIAVNLRSANLRNADLSDAILWHTNLSDADLEGANLSGADLRYTIVDAKTRLDYKWQLVQKIVNRGARDLNLINKNLSNSNLMGASMSNATLTNADLSRANLSRANLSQTNLANCRLLQSNLTSANLDQANLVDANLIGADLRNAHLLRANLTNTDLSGADVGNAKFGGNLGISESMKYNLIQRGAIFEDAPGDPSWLLAIV